MDYFQAGHDGSQLSSQYLDKESGDCCESEASLLYVGVTGYCGHSETLSESP